MMNVFVILGLFLTRETHAAEASRECANLTTGNYRFDVCCVFALMTLLPRFVETAMSWFAANNYCKDLGAKLAEINSKEENAAIVGEIKRGYKDKSMYFWIGLTDDEEEGTWRLASNGEEAEYLNWDGSNTRDPEPNNYEGNEDCALIRPSSCFGTRKDAWADLDCNQDWVEVFCTPRSPPVVYTMHALCEFGDQPCNFTLSGTTCNHICFNDLILKGEVRRFFFICSKFLLAQN